MASAIPELEEPAQAKAALTRLWQARQFHEGAALATGASLEAEAAAREALLAEASDARKEEAWIILTDALVRQERAALQARRGHRRCRRRIMLKPLMPINQPAPWRQSVRRCIWGCCRSSCHQVNGLLTFFSRRRPPE